MTQHQPSLWDQPDPEAAAVARAEGIALADEMADGAWKLLARAVIRQCATLMVDFTADDVVVALDQQGAPRTHNLAALGPVFLAAARAGEIRKTGALRPSRIARRHRDLTVWASGSYPAHRTPDPRSTP